MSQQSQPYRSWPVSLHFEADGLGLHYLDWGEGPSSHLVLLHGLASQAHRWDDFAGAVHDLFRVVTLDLRGHGLSDHTEEGYTLPLFAADVKALARHLNLQQFDLLGHSLGAMAAINFTAQNPGLVRRLVLEDGGPGMNVEAARQGSYEAYLRPLGFDTPEEAKAWLSTQHPEEGDERIGRRFAHTMKQNWADKWVPRHDHELYWIVEGSSPKVAGAERQLWENLAGIQCPALLVHGRESPLLSEETAREIVRKLPQGNLVDIPGAGHSVSSEAPELFREAVMSFLKT